MWTRRRFRKVPLSASQLKGRAETIFRRDRFLGSRPQDGQNEPHIGSAAAPRIEISNVVLEGQGLDPRLIRLSIRFLPHPAWQYHLPATNNTNPPPPPCAPKEHGPTSGPRPLAVHGQEYSPRRAGAHWVRRRGLVAYCVHESPLPPRWSSDFVSSKPCRRWPEGFEDRVSTPPRVSRRRMSSHS